MTAGLRPTTSTVRELVAALGSLAPAVDDRDRIDRVRLFEELKSAAAAAQALEARDFDRSQRAAQAVAGEPSARQGRGVAAQLALARRCSPWAAQRWLGWCKILPEELPHTFAALQTGLITEWRASLVARETLFLSREDRMAVDAELAPHVEGWGDKRVAAEARRAGYRLDPHGSLARCRAAEKDRRVTLRPAPDTMTRLTALLPVKQGVAAYAALCQAADTTTATGDGRGRGQIMADTLVERVTGQATADAVAVEIALVITDTTLTNGDGEPDAGTDDPRIDTSGTARSGDDGSSLDGSSPDEPGEILGYGPVPAGLAREIALGTNQPARDTETDAARRSIRRLFQHPLTRQLMTMDSTAREFTRNERRFIRYRDRDTCRTPWCDARLRHTDHVRAREHGGRTHVDNGQGLCEACNHAKQANGWRARPRCDGSIVTATPTGHTYESRQPDLPGTAPPSAPDVDLRLDALRRRGRLAA